jgi:hypothetical protein
LKKNCRKRKQRRGESKMSKKEKERLDTTIKKNNKKPLTVSLLSPQFIKLCYHIQFSVPIVKHIIHCEDTKISTSVFNY